MSRPDIKYAYGIPYNPNTERLVLANGVDRPCGWHPPPTTIEDAICCQECGACKVTGHPLVYVEQLTEALH